MNMVYNGTKTAALERVHYFPRQLITADDLIAEQQYFREKLRRHNRHLHGWGVVCGCEVKANPTAEHPWQVSVCPGYVITPLGDEIEIPRAVDFDLAGNWQQAFDPCPQPPPCPPTGPPPATREPVTAYLAICYTECSSRPVRIHPAGCGCDETACEYSRVRESFELLRLWKEPESHRLAREAIDHWRQQYTDWISNAATDPFPLPECPPAADPCVVLATIKLPTDRGQWLKEDDIDRSVRKSCVSTALLTEGILQAVGAI